MRVAILQDHLRNGGTENQSLHIAEGLAQAGIETHLIVFRRGGILDSKAQSSSFQLHYLPQKWIKTDWAAPRLACQIKSAKANVVIAMGRMANCRLGLLAGKQGAIKLVSTFRTGKPIPFLYRRALRRADRIVANSHEAVRRIRDQYGIDRPHATSVIYNGCIRSFDTAVDYSSTQGDEAIRLVNASMFRPEKQQINLLRVCSKLPKELNWTLTLAGEGSEKQRCQKEAERLGIAERTRFLGLLADPSQLYAESAIAIHVSRSESLPNFLVEAQMSGLPVIAYDTGGSSECFVDKKSGYLIDQGDDSAFLEKLAFLANSPELRQQMSKAAREHAATNFSSEAQLKAYLDLLNELTP